MDRSFVSAFGEKFAFFCTNISSENKLANGINWHQIYHVGRDELDGKADGCSQ